MTFTLDDDTIRTLRTIAERRKKPQSLVVREAVAPYAAREKNSTRPSAFTAARARRAGREAADTTAGRRAAGTATNPARPARRLAAVVPVMLIHLDTTVLVDAFSGGRHSLPAVRTATARGDSLTFSTIVLYRVASRSEDCGRDVGGRRVFCGESPRGLRERRGAAGRRALPPGQRRSTTTGRPGNRRLRHPPRRLTLDAQSRRFRRRAGAGPLPRVKVPAAICNLQSEMM